MVNLKGMAGVFAAVTFLTGFLLIDRGSISGNAVVTSDPTVGVVPIVGLVLVAVALGLAVYSMKK